MKDKVFRVLFIAVTVFYLLIAFGSSVKADMGPKPSIKLTVVNASDDYYVALLDCYPNEDRTNSELKLDNVTDESVNAYLEEFVYDRWHFFQSPVGNNVFHSTEEGVYDFTYSVPNPFRVVLISADGTVKVSEEFTKEEYNAVCTYDAASGKITEYRTNRIARRVIYTAICYILTILIELGVLAAFGYPFNKFNIICFFMINTITNIPYNIVIANMSKGGIALIVFSFLMECLIFVVEALFYLFTIKYKDGTVHHKRNLFYSIAANAASAAFGFVGLFIAAMFI